MLFYFIKAIFVLYHIASSQLSNIPPTDLSISNSTGLLPLITVPFVIAPQFNTDVCPFKWPIQRHNLSPATTLNDIAHILMYLEPVPAKPLPPNTCAPSLPIQRHQIYTVTGINDVAAIVAAHHAALEQPFDDVSPTGIPEMCLMILIPLLLSAVQNFRLVYCLACLAFITVAKHLASRKYQQQLAGQAELIQSLRMQLEASRFREHQSTSRARQLEAISLSQRTRIDRLRQLNTERANTRGDIATTQPISPPNLDTTSIIPSSPPSEITGYAPSSSHFTSATSSTLFTSPEAPPIIVPSTGENAGNSPEVAKIITETIGMSLPLPDTPSTTSCDSHDTPITTGVEGDGDGWRVVQRHKKQRECRSAK